MKDTDFIAQEKLSAEAEDMKRDELRELEKPECHHICTSNCRREGCNCECGEWHIE